MPTMAVQARIKTETALKATMKREFKHGDILAKAASKRGNTIEGVAIRKKADTHYTKAHAAGDKLDALRSQ